MGNEDAFETSPEALLSVARRARRFGVSARVGRLARLTEAAEAMIRPYESDRKVPVDILGAAYPLFERIRSVLAGHVGKDRMPADDDDRLIGDCLAEARGENAGIGEEIRFGAAAAGN